MSKIWKSLTFTAAVVAVLLASSETRAVEITLGGDALTRGIPGSGPLTLTEINEWLDDPANHEVIQVKLPLGLAGGALQIVGLEENPLTRAKIELGRQLYFDTPCSNKKTRASFKRSRVTTRQRAV